MCKNRIQESSWKRLQKPKKRKPLEIQGNQHNLLQLV